MALTDSKTGFRLPWATDRSASREAPAEPAEPVSDETVAEAPAVEASETTTPTQDAPGDAAQLDQEGTLSTFAPTTANPVHEAPTTWAHPEPAPAAEAAEAAPEARPHDQGPPTGTPARKPTRFMADLTRAMQAAAEQARGATIEQYHADGTVVIEEIHARTATTADELRRRADADVAAIKDWSKAEIARIREETERRVSGRREQLEGQLERHAALVEHEIERVRSRIAAFEAEMGRFFDGLLAEEDPAHFAARAASLPEPPPFEPLDDDALEAILAEPGQGVPPPPAAPEPEPEAVAEAAVVEIAPAETADTVDSTALLEVEQAAQAEPVDQAEQAEQADWAEQVDGAAAEADAFDRETAMAAIQAAAEAAAAVEAAGVEADRAEAAADRAEAIVAEVEVESTEAGTESGDAWWPAEPTPIVEAETFAATAEPAAEQAGELVAEAAPEPELDPRLAMLGLTPDFAAAEAAAAEAAAAEAEAVPEIGGDLLAARLSGLVPDEPREPAPTITTQVVTTGLVSVASIASFKRHLGRLPGVVHVGVSSGPDGEFVFAVEHDAETALRDLVPTVPGFGARVVSSGDGVMQVSAQDPQD